ncbi:uncharacterized protein LOC126316828 [Schistocerca gregaria]|uniref:uncharacterized protein LOC126316828 n=1 Tax=Schistocerca gregaria TaxID=7010 RepID=UPI00211EAFA8|nr:uncharacterized protein LOC126316828 [Schistocerca gregaria]
MPNMTLESMTPLIEHELSIYTRYQRHDLRRSCLDVVLNGRYREDGLYYCWALTNRALVIRDVGEQSDEASPLLEEAVSLEAEYAKRGKKPCWMRKFRVEVLIAKGWLMIQRVEGAVNPSSVQESLGGLAACFESWGRLMGGDGDVLRLRSLNQHARLLALLHDVGPLLHFYGNFELYIVCLKLMLKLYSVEKGDEASRANTLLCYTRMGEIYHYLGYSSSLVSDCFIRSCSERGVEGGCLEDTERVIKALDYFQQIGRVDKRSGLSRLKQIVCSLEQGIYVNSAQVTKEMYQVLALGRYALASLKVVFGEVDEAIIESKMALQLRQLILPQKDSSLKRLTEMASKIASSRGMPCRWRFVHCFADSLEQLGVLYKLQGAFRMSEYYLKKGLELAHSLNSEYLQNRILLHLSRLYHRADKVDAWKEVLKELDAFQYMQADRGPRNLAKVPEIAINGLIHVGNWYLKVEESIDHVLWSYREAEWYLSLTKDEYDMKTLEERTSVMSIVAEEREIGVLGQRLGVRLEGETRAELEGADITLNDYMLLRRMESRILLKKGIAMFYAARRVSESEKRERLVEARELLSGVVDRLDCLGRFVPLEAEKALAMLNLAEIDLILLDGLESAVADEGACCASSDGVRGCWNRGFEGSEIEGRRMEEIRDRLKGALDLCVSSGSMPLLTSSICKVLASTIGVLDAWRTAALLNYAVGMTIRHQALCDIYDKALSVKKKGGEVWKRFSDSSEHCDEGEPPSCREAAGGSRDSLRLAEDLDAEVSDAKKWPKVLSSALPKSEKWAGWYRWNRAELSGRPFHESVSKLLNFHKLCKHWTVATLCLDLDGDHLMVTRIQRGQSPIVARRSLVQVISGFETVESLKVLSKQFTESVLVSNASASSFRISKKKVQCLPAQMPSDRARHSRSSYGTASFGQLVSQFDQIIRELDKPAVKEKADSEFLVAWWRHRIQLNTRLGLLINQMEDCLLGPWKVLLLGDYESSAVNRRLDSSVSSLERHLNKILRPYCPDFIISRSLLRAILFGVDVLTPAQLEEALAYLFGMEAVTRGDGCSYKWRLVRGAAQESDILKLASSLLVSTYNGVLGDFRQLGIRLSSSFKYVVSQKAVMMQKIEQVPRHPTILILDKQLHRLPWESFPSLCCAPISRMPSLAFMRAWILAHLHPRSPSNILRDGLQTDKTFYVLNPGGDLKRTQELLSPIFEQECEWKGIVNQIPEKEEIEDALSRHQLFIYCGHNAGEHYLSRSDIQKIESGVGGCVALLMGCASLKIDDHAEFEPSSLAFSYIISGTQCLVGNLWSVTAGDLDLETQRILQWIRGNREDEDDDSRSLAHIISLARSIKEIKFKYLNAAALVCYGLPVYKREKFQATCISKK